MSEIKMIQGESRLISLKVTSDGCSPIDLSGATDIHLSFKKKDGIGLVKLASLQRSFAASAVATSSATANPNTITIPAHGLVDNDKTQLSTTGSLPTGLSLVTDYFVIVVDEDTISFAASKDGSAIALTAIGSGINTLSLVTAALASGPLGLVTLTVSQAALLAMLPVEKATRYLSYTIGSVVRLVKFEKNFTVIDPDNADCAC